MRRSLILFVVLLIGDSCKDQIDFNSPDAASQLVVDGFITDSPGPYTIKLTRTKKILDFTSSKTVSASLVAIYDNVGNSEVLTETSPGIFQTKANGIRGVIGREYYTRIETRDGKIYESIPEKLVSAGSIEKVYYTFEKFSVDNGSPKYQFRIFLDSKGDVENQYRWKFIATYKVQTSPELHTTLVGEARLADPPACSGYIKDGKSGGIRYVNPCTCCTCYVSIIKPKVSTSQVLSDGQFKGVEMGAVPIDYWIFSEKVQVEIRQYSLSKAASRYWATVQAQKDGAASLFQPAVGKAVSNLIVKNGSDEVQGLFSVSSVASQTIFLTINDIPLGPTIIPPAPPGAPESCNLAYSNSTTQKPIDW